MGPLSIEKIVQNSQEIVNFEDENLYFGELDVEFF